MIRAPRWYHGWNIVAAAILAQVATLGLPINCFSLFLGHWSRDLSTPVSTLTLAVSALSLACLFISPLAGVVADRAPAKKLFAVTLSLVVVFHVAIACVTAGWQIILLYGLVGAAAAAFGSNIPSQTMVSRWFVRRRGLAIGLTAFGLAAAGIVFPLIISLLVPALGWRGAWWAFALAIGILVLPTVVIIVRDRPGPHDRLDYVDSSASTEAAGPRLRLKAILTRRNFVAATAAMILLQFIYFGLLVNLAPLAASRGYDLATSGGLLAMLSLAAVISKLGCGLLADRVGNKTPLVLVALVSAVAVVLLMVSSSLAAMNAAYVLLGLSAGIWTVAPSTIAAEFGPKNFGQALGLQLGLVTLGSLSPPAFAKLQEMSGAYTHSLWMLLGVSALAITSALVLKQDRAFVGERPAS